MGRRGGGRRQDGAPVTVGPFQVGGEFVEVGGKGMQSMLRLWSMGRGVGEEVFVEEVGVGLIEADGVEAVHDEGGGDVAGAAA